MEPVRIFYSWQSDRDRSVCGRFIALALEEAVDALRQKVRAELEIDSDTSGVAGTPPVSETILGKIRSCDIFIGDVSFVGSTQTGKLLPNPNVMTEFGYARGTLDDQQILLVMNKAFGPPEALPFDLAHLRHPLSYTLAEGAADGVRRQARAAFAQKLATALGASVDVALKRRGARDTAPESIKPVQDLLTALDQLTGRGDVPAIVPGPRLVIRVAPHAAANDPPLDPAKVKSARQHFVPEGYARCETAVDNRQWASFDPPRHVRDAPNPESRWYMRLVRPGVLEMTIMVGARIDDDTTIIVEGRALEGRLVEAAARCARILAEIGLDGALLLSASVHGLEDVQIMGSRRASRPLGLPSVFLGTVAVAHGEALTPARLRPLFDALWLGAGFEDGSPSFDNDEWAGTRMPSHYEPEVIGGSGLAVSATGRAVGAGQRRHMGHIARSSRSRRTS